METGFVYYGNCRHTDGTIGSSSGEAGSRRPGDFQHIAAKRVVRAPLQETNTKNLGTYKQVQQLSPRLSSATMVIVFGCLFTRWYH